jgi:hypothetical protein
VRPHVEHHLFALRELPGIRERLAGHEPLHEVEVFVEAVALLLWIAVVADELVREVARADAVHQAPAAHHVQHRVGLGQASRIVEGQDRDRRAQPDAPGALRQRRQHDGRIGHHAVFVEVMLGAEEGVVAQALGELALAHDLLIQLRDAPRQLRVVVVDGKQGIAHLGPDVTI